MWSSDLFVPGVVVTDGRWHHLAVVLDGASGQVWVDGRRPPMYVWDGARYGELRAQPVTLPRPPATAPRGFRLGAGNSDRGSWARSFRGELDNLAIYGRALSAAELRSHHRVLQVGA